MNPRRDVKMTAWALVWQRTVMPPIESDEKTFASLIVLAASHIGTLSAHEHIAITIIQAVAVANNSSCLPFARIAIGQFERCTLTLRVIGSLAPRLNLNNNGD